MDFFLDMLTTEMTPVTSSSSEMMKPLPTSEEKYMKVFLPASLTATPTVPSLLCPDLYIPTLPLLRPPTEATELALLSSPAPPRLIRVKGRSARPRLSSALLYLDTAVSTQRNEPRYLDMRVICTSRTCC